MTAATNGVLLSDCDREPANVKATGSDPKYVVVEFGSSVENDCVVYRGNVKRAAKRQLREAYVGGGDVLMYGPNGITDPAKVWGESVFPTGDMDCDR